MSELFVENISFAYGKKKVLDNVSFEADNGVIALLGPNGAGKSTLINIIVGLFTPDEGRILLGNEDISKLGRSYYDHIGYMPQSPRFYNDYTVYEFLWYMAKLKGIDNKKTKARIEELLELVNLSDARKKKVGALSGGMRQRLGIAQSMLNNPKILVLDEPTAGLDPIERMRLKNTITKIAADRIVIMATHIVSDVENMANKVFMLKEGKNLMYDTPKAILESTYGHIVYVEAETVEELRRLEREQTVITVSNGDDGGYRVKIVSDSKDNVVPRSDITLEDVFAYYFGGECVYAKD